MSTPLVRMLLIVILLASVVVAPAVAQGAPAVQAPAFTLELFNGASLKLADLRGKAVVVLFWAEW